MSITVPAPVRRWAVPASAALAVIGGGVAIGVVTNAADSALPPRSAEELLVDLQTAQVDGLQGTVTFRADLGLPPLPVPSLGSADLGSLASGTHTLRVWYAHPGQARVALLGRDSETDIVTNGDEIWIWSSKEKTAVHAPLPEGGIAGLLGLLLTGGPTAALPSVPPLPEATGRPDGAGLPDLGGAATLNAERIAQLALTALEFLGTDVTTDNDVTVAGRAAYELTLTPRDARSLIASIAIAVDAETGLPLRLAVLARNGGAPAFEVGFTELSLTRPDPAQFQFNPPLGTEVIEADELDLSGRSAPRPDEPEVSGEDPSERPRWAMIGSGWTTVLAVRLPDHPDAAEGPRSEVLDLLPVASGDWGSGRLLETRLFTVLLTDDGRLLAGAVPPSMLYEAAADPAARLDS